MKIIFVFFSLTAVNQLGHHDDNEVELYWLLTSPEAD